MDPNEKIKSQFPIDTLLRKFVLKRIASYEAPVRKGKTRGELIGMGREKFIAAILYGVTNLPLIQISELTGVPYGSLRHSIKHKGFVTVADGELGAFSVTAMQYLEGRIAAIRTAVNGGADFYVEIAKEPPAFDDARFYRENVCRQISWLYFRTFTSAAALIACPRDLFKKVMDLIFAAQMLTKETNPWSVRRMVERAFLDRVNEFLRLNRRPLLAGGTPDPHLKSLILLYIDMEHEFHAEEK